VRGLSEKKAELVIRDIESILEKEAVVPYLAL
jgi:hypothetical protein